MIFMALSFYGLFRAYFLHENVMSGRQYVQQQIGTLLILSFTNKLMVLQWLGQHLQGRQEFMSRFMNKLHMACPLPPPPAWVGLKILEKYLLGCGQQFLFWWGVYCCGGGIGCHGILKEKLKLHNPSIKIISRIIRLTL